MTSRYGRGAAGLLVVLALVAAWNVLRYPPGLGYDAIDHIAYAEGIADGHGLPDGVGEYYTPPGFYAVAAGAIRLGRALGLGQPLRLVQLTNALLLIGTAVLVLELARLVFPGRRVLALAAIGLFACGALAPKAAAMVHPEVMSMFFCALALVGAAYAIARRRFGLLVGAGTGAALGAAQLVRAFSLWTFAVVIIALVVSAVVLPEQRRRMLVTLAAALVSTLLVAGPWYGYQASRYTNPVFDRPQIDKPLWERRPLSFYVDPGVPDVISRPFKPHFANRFWPQLYAEGWGDYYGVFVWNNGRPEPTAAERRTLVAQMALALVPTLLFLAGWIMLSLRMLRPSRLRSSPELLLVTLLPLAAVAGMLYFTVSYPTTDGDVIKATYTITALPAFALCFGYAVDEVVRRRRRLGIALAIVLVLAAASGVRVAVFGSPLGIL